MIKCQGISLSTKSGIARLAYNEGLVINTQKNIKEYHSAMKELTALDHTFLIRKSSFYLVDYRSLE